MKNDRMRNFTTAQRLAAYRTKANDYALSNDPKKFTKGYAHSWLYWRRPLCTPMNNTRGKDGEIFASDKAQYGDWIGSVGDLKVCDHSGWYADNFRQNLVIGGVVRIHTSKGTYYVPVTYHDDWDCATTYWMGDAELVPKSVDRYEHDEDAHYTAQNEAARMADRYAEREAEQYREDDAKDQAEQQIIEARALIHEINKKVLPLIRESRAKDNGFTPSICEALRESVAGYMAQRTEQFNTIARLSRNYWLAVE